MASTRLKFKPAPPPEQLLKLAYDPATGELRWIREGWQAGHVGPYGYRLVGLGGMLYMAHRLAWLFATGEWPASDIDHINGNRDDNRISNLRVVDRSGNNENTRHARSNSKTGLLGVSVCTVTGRFRAQITTRGVTRHLGSHDTPELAHAAYLKAKRELHEGCTI